MVLGSLRREDTDEDINMNKFPSIIPEAPDEPDASVDEAVRKEHVSDKSRDDSKESEVVSSMKSVNLNPERDSGDSAILMARKGSSRGYSFGNSRTVIEPLLQNALDLVGNMSPKRMSVLKANDINAPFIALNPPILPILDNENPTKVFLAPGVSKGPEQQRHAQGIDVESEAEEDPW